MISGKGRLFIISAPSGAGKDTIINRLLKLREDIVLSVSATTRAPRKGETDGVSYYFVTHEKFHSMIENGEFLEYAEYVGEYYGTPVKPVYENIKNAKNVILKIEVQGAKQVLALEPDTVTIFIVPPDLEELERRLRKRGTDSEEKLKSRVEKAALEIEERVHYKHVVVNDDLNRAIEEVLSIIESSTNEHAH